MNIINLPNWVVVGIQQSQHDYRIEASYTVEPATCTHCGRGRLFNKLYRHGTRPQLLMDVPAHGKRVVIVLHRVRYRCQDCGKTFLQPIPDMDAGGSMTIRLVRHVEAASLLRTFSSIAEEVGIDEKTVRNIFNAHVARLDETVTFVTPEWLGIDEVYLLRKPRCVLTNVKEATVIEVMPDRYKKTVIERLGKLRDKDRVLVVTMDMSRTFRDAVAAKLPDAVVVIDKFHVVRMASQSMEAVRKSIRGGLDDKSRRKMMHDRFILLRRLKGLEDNQVETMESWFKLFPLLKTAHELKEGFYNIWDECDTRQKAEAAYAEWEAKIPAELTSAFKPVVTAVKNWRTEIFAYFDHRATNATTEALNGLTKVVARNGRGYSFRAIRAKMLYARPSGKNGKPRYGSGWEPAAIEAEDRPKGGCEPEQCPFLGTKIQVLLELMDMPEPTHKMETGRGR
jgi:transposase